jgi:DNA-binding transcriptional LysR family regulator
MPKFSDIELRRMDLTLLLVFEEAMASRKLSAAAKRLGLTQSAISHALKRLRGIFGDELFIRTPRGVVPTARALALRAPLAEAVALIAGTVRTVGFDPSRAERTFRIAAPDYETALFAPLLADTRSAGPLFIFQPLVRRQAIEALTSAEIDLVLGYSKDRYGGCERETLFEDDYLVVARTGHPVLGGELTIEQYTSLEHVLVSPGGTLSGIVDTALAAEGRSRHVVVAIPYFLAALATVARSDLIATVPRGIASLHGPSFGLGSIEPPMPIRRFPVSMTWDRRTSTDSAIMWLRERMRAVAKSAALRGTDSADGRRVGI